MIIRDLVEPGFFHRRPAIDDRTRRTTEGYADPIIGLVALAVFLAEETPAAIALAEIFRDVGELDDLVDVDVRVVGPADDDVGTGAGIRRHGGLLADVFPADEIDTGLDPGRLLELCRVGAENGFVGLDETRRAQNPQTCATLNRELRGCDVSSLNLGTRGVGNRHAAIPPAVRRSASLRVKMVAMRVSLPASVGPKVNLRQSRRIGQPSLMARPPDHATSSSAQRI